MSPTRNEATPTLTIVIPTHNRHEEVVGAVESALAQTLADVEVVVVDDASAPPVELTPHPRVRCVRLEENRGFPGARNAGLAAARGRWITFLDDDDRLLPDMAAASLAAIERSSLPPPVCVISAIEAVGYGGRVLDRRVPTSHPRGEHFFLETGPFERSYMTKQTLVVERDLLRSVGGFDPTFRSRAMSDLFLRLNPVCSIEAIPTVTYQLTRTPGPRDSRKTDNVERGFWQLVDKHRALFESHREGYAEALLGHARMSLVVGPRRAVVPAIARALRVAPRHTLRILLSPRRAIGLVRTWRSSG
jgi:glycosyltransferase involved in cell wall biosynthesis